ncbi:redoxin domain-containing protein [Massilia sp. IC2-477]|uniref:redoxin domain-containing protein n=1 Tax=Massilia sp. IC2-477 TaxID=2887198 RepID=UPI001D11E282|nr:redoxin domain-containing protein [Massilia sp. IC2-477]MCC2957545.1 redoxin domain-containing protein [Massilia sp. IC2-477]
MNAPTLHPAPEFEVSGWLNAAGPVSLASLRGRVVAVYAFQMLCPGCVAHALPQAKQLGQHFGRNELAVLGLHTVFEHHEAMNEAALAAFLHEYRIEFPVGVDRPGEDGPIPRTMERYRMRGTPTLLLFDRQGVLRHSLFGHLPDLQVGALIGRLLAEPEPGEACDDGGCRIPGGS